MNYKVSIESHVWKKDTNSLFDYESNDFTMSQTIVTDNCLVYRNEKNMLNFGKENNLKNNFLVEIKKSEDNYFLNFEKSAKIVQSHQNDEKNFVVIRHTAFDKNFGYRLKKGDIIKFGKMIFKINELFVHTKESEQDKLKWCLTKHTRWDNGPSNNREDDENKENKFLILNANKTSSKNVPLIKDLKQEKVKNTKKKLNITICKICLIDENDDSNPLINPCKCSGSMKYIHLDCLKHWLKSKVITKILNYLIIHSYQPFVCEICKFPIPERIKIKNEFYNLIEFQKSTDDSISNYIVFETIPKEPNDFRYIYIIQMKEKNSMQIGRSNDSDVRMTDISVSRNHAKIRLVNDSYYLEDNYSKFGTLAQIHSELMLLPNKIMSLQIGKSFTSFFVQKTFRGMLNCCYFYPHRNIKDYNDLFDFKECVNEVIYSCDNPCESLEVTENLSSIVKTENKNLIEKSANEFEENKIDIDPKSICNDGNKDVKKEESVSKNNGEYNKIDDKNIQIHNYLETVKKHLDNSDSMSNVSAKNQNYFLSQFKELKTINELIKRGNDLKLNNVHIQEKKNFKILKSSKTLDLKNIPNFKKILNAQDSDIPASSDGIKLVTKDKRKNYIKYNSLTSGLRILKINENNDIKIKLKVDTNTLIDEERRREGIELFHNQFNTFHDLKEEIFQSVDKNYDSL